MTLIGSCGNPLSLITQLANSLGQLSTNCRVSRGVDRFWNGPTGAVGGGRKFNNWRWSLCLSDLKLDPELQFGHWVIAKGIWLKCRYGKSCQSKRYICAFVAFKCGSPFSIPRCWFNYSGEKLAQSALVTNQLSIASRNDHFRRHKLPGILAVCRLNVISTAYNSHYSHLDGHNKSEPQKIVATVESIHYIFGSVGLSAEVP